MWAYDRYSTFLSNKNLKYGRFLNIYNFLFIFFLFKVLFFFFKVYLLMKKKLSLKAIYIRLIKKVKHMFDAWGMLEKTFFILLCIILRELALEWFQTQIQTVKLVGLPFFIYLALPLPGHNIKDSPDSLRNTLLHGQDYSRGRTLQHITYFSIQDEYRMSCLRTKIKLKISRVAFCTISTALSTYLLCCTDHRHFYSRWIKK